MNDHQVLVVEDDPDIRQSLIDALEDHGYGVLSAVNGQDALEKLASADPRPCLILLDMMMPVMDGREFRQEQLRDPELAKVPVVVLSAYRDVAQAAGDLKAHAYMSKPVRLTELMSTIAEAC
jgi:CheY-like chemotaxis protein